jgi:CTP:molybdopterin cytidylyltransferase MocA
MGRPKLSLPLAGSTVIQLVVTALRNGGADPVVVVVAPHNSELAELAEAAGAAVCRLTDATADMRETVMRGLDWLEERCAPRPEDDWLLAPADHPTLDAEVVRLLRERSQSYEPAARTREAEPSLARRACRPSIFVPVCDGRRGHPVLLAWRHVEAIRALPAGTGLNVYLRTHAEETEQVTVESKEVLRDLDTAEDYERLQQAWQGRDTPFSLASSPSVDYRNTRRGEEVERRPDGPSPA